MVLFWHDMLEDFEVFVGHIAKTGVKMQWKLACVSCNL